MPFKPYSLLAASLIFTSCQANSTIAPTPILQTRGADLSFAFSPDSEKLAVSMVGYGTLPEVSETLRKKSNSLYIFDLKTQQVTQHARGLDALFLQHWSPDSKMLAYSTSSQDIALLNIANPVTAITTLNNVSPYSSGVTWSSADQLTGFHYNEGNGLQANAFDTASGNLTATTSPAMSPRTIALSPPESHPVVGYAQTLAENSFLVKETYFPNQEAWLKVSNTSEKIFYHALAPDTISENAQVSSDHAYLYYDEAPLSPLDTRLQSKMKRLNLSSGEPLDLGEGFMPMLSPDGKQLAFLKANQLVIASPEGNNPREILASSALAGSSVHAYQWQPNSQKLWVLTAPDKTSEFVFEDKPVVNTRYGNVNLIEPEILTTLKLYEIDVQTGTRTERKLDWAKLKADLG